MSKENPRLPISFLNFFGWPLLVGYWMFFSSFNPPGCG